MERPKTNNQIRDLNGCDWYWISRALLQSYGRTLKPSGIAVYNVLASFANSKNQSCFPSHKTIARIAGMSKRTVSERLRQLEKLALIRRESQKGPTIYHLLAISGVKKGLSEGQRALLKGEKSDL